jgi:hypothetical protein
MVIYYKGLAKGLKIMLNFISLLKNLETLSSYNKFVTPSVLVKRCCLGRRYGLRSTTLIFYFYKIFIKTNIFILL